MVRGDSHSTLIVPLHPTEQMHILLSTLANNMYTTISTRKDMLPGEVTMANQMEI